jgi:hypothetical protein
VRENTTSIDGRIDRIFRCRCDVLRFLVLWPSPLVLLVDVAQRGKFMVGALQNTYSSI